MVMSTVTVSQRQLDEYTIGLGRAQDRIAELEREAREKDAVIRVKHAALVVAEGLLSEYDDLLTRYHAATSLPEASAA